MKNEARERLSPSVSLSLAFRFMLLLAFAMLSLSFLFVLLLKFSVRHKQDMELEKSITAICENLEAGSVDELGFLELPYYITYTVYDFETKEVLATNDSLLPLLNSDKAKNYFIKDFFTDSDLNIRFLTRKINFSGKEIIAECAFDIVNDSAARMLALLPIWRLSL